MFSLSWKLNQFFKIKTIQEKAKTQQKCDFCFLFYKNILNEFQNKT